MFDLGRALGSGDQKGLEEYGELLHIDSPIDAYTEAMEEIADAAKYLTLLEMRYQDALAETLRLKALLAEAGIASEPDQS